MSTFQLNTGELATTMLSQLVAQRDPGQRAVNRMFDQSLDDGVIVTEERKSEAILRLAEKITELKAAKADPSVIRALKESMERIGRIGIRS